MAADAIAKLLGAGGADSGTYTAETLERRRKIADELMGFGKQRKITHWAEGFAQMGEAALGGYMHHKLDEEGKASEKALNDEALNWVGGGAAGTSRGSPAITGFRTSAVHEVPADQFNSIDAMADLKPETQQMLPRAQQAIANIESRGGDYSAMGPAITSGPMAGQRAVGKYQVMESNIGPWTKEIMGRAMTPQEFAANPDAQDAVFNGKFGGYADKYGSADAASRAWLAGEGGMNNPAARDQLGTSVAGYSGRFNKDMASPAMGFAPVNPSQSPFKVAGIGPVAGPGGDPMQTAALPPNAGTETSTPSTNTRVAQALNAPAASSAASASDVRAKITQMLSSNDPRVRAFGRQLGMGLVQQEMKPNTYGFQTLPDGTILRTDPRTGSVQPIYQAKGKPTWGVIGEDEGGKKAYGWIDPTGRTVEPYKGVPGDGKPQTVTGPDGKQIEIPAGQDPKKFREHITTATADARAGKMTEVQAAATQYGNRMEQAEQNIGKFAPAAHGISGALGGAARTVTGGQYNPIPRGLTNWAVPEKYEQLEQAKSQWITALLRKESGAAISPSEFDRYDKEFFPQLGDSGEVVQQKTLARQTAIEGMKKGAGPVYTPPSTLRPAGQGAPSTSSKADDPLGIR